MCICCQIHSCLPTDFCASRYFVCVRMCAHQCICMCVACVHTTGDPGKDHERAAGSGIHPLCAGTLGDDTFPRHNWHALHPLSPPKVQAHLFLFHFHPPSLSQLYALVDSPWQFSPSFVCCTHTWKLDSLLCLPTRILKQSLEWVNYLHEYGNVSCGLFSGSVNTVIDDFVIVQLGCSWSRQECNER